MYAIIEESGGQRKVVAGDEILIDLHGEGQTQAGTAITFDRVLVVGKEGGAAKIGQPYVAGASVKGEVVEGVVKGEKVFIQKFGPKVTQEEILQATRLGMIELTQEDTRFRVPSPRLLNAGIQLVGEGLPLGELLDIIEGVRNNVEFVADELVKLVVRLVFDPYGKDKLPPPEDVERLTNLIWRLRPIADIAIAAEVGRAMEKAINDHLSERLVAVMTHMKDEQR